MHLPLFLVKIAVHPLRLPWPWMLLATHMYNSLWSCGLPPYLPLFLSVFKFVPCHPCPKWILFLWCKSMCSQQALTESISGLLLGFSWRFEDYREDSLSTRLFWQLSVFIRPSLLCPVHSAGLGWSNAAHFTKKTGFGAAPERWPLSPWNHLREKSVFGYLKPWALLDSWCKLWFVVGILGPLQFVGLLDRLETGLWGTVTKSWRDWPPVKATDARA